MRFCLAFHLLDLHIPCLLACLLVADLLDVVGQVVYRRSEDS